MSNPYIAQDNLDQCREAMRQGRSLEQLAGQLRCDPEHLARLLGLPAIKRSGPETGCDLWRTDEVESQL